MSQTANEKVLRQKVLDTVTGAGKPENMEKDAEHIYEAQKYGSYFVTTDDKLLERGTPSEILTAVELLLVARILFQSFWACETRTDNYYVL